MNVLHSRCSRLRTCGFALLLLVLVCNTGMSAQPLEQNSAANPVADISLLLDHANHALDADPLTSPFRKNALLYIDQVLILDPGNLHAYILLYAVVTHYSRIVELLLETTDSANFGIQLAEAEKFRNQTEQVISAYQLDQDIVLRMNRLITLTRDKCHNSVGTAEEGAAKMKQGECYQQALGDMLHTPTPQPGRNLQLEKKVLSISTLGNPVKRTDITPESQSIPATELMEQPVQQELSANAQDNRPVAAQQEKVTDRWNNRQRVIGRF